MNIEPIALDKIRAKELYRAYKTHQHYSEPIDWEVQRTYQFIAQGKLVIKALEAIVAAGLDEQGRPKLAIVRADQARAECTRERRRDGSMDATFRPADAVRSKAHDMVHRVQYPVAPPYDQASSQGNYGWYNRLLAIVPLIPLDVRPKRGLQNYHILWEADWKAVPRDPLLLRRIGKGDLWLVLAQWDLTEVERAALQARVRP